MGAPVAIAFEHGQLISIGLNAEKTLRKSLHHAPVCLSSMQSRKLHLCSTISRDWQREKSSRATWTTFSRGQLGQIASFWKALEGNACSPMQQYIWNEVSQATLPIGGELLVVVVQTGPRTGAIAPLVRMRGSLHRLEHLGVKHLHEPADFLYSDYGALKELASALVDLRSPLFLERIPAESPTIAAIQDAYRDRGKVFLRPASRFPRIELSADWREPERQLSSAWRSALRRATRTADKMGRITFEVLSPNPSELDRLLEEALEVESANWKGRQGTSVLCDPLRGKFYRQYAAAASRAGTLRLSFLRVGGRAAAMQLAVECEGRFWLLKIGFREEFSRCSPGMLLISESIRYSACKGLSSFEFLGTAESWTRVWTKDERASVSLRAYPIGMTGIAAVAFDSLRVICKRLGRVIRGTE